MNFHVAPQKRSNGLKSYDLGGQLITPQGVITRPGNMSFNKAIFARIVWHVATHILQVVFFNSRQKSQLSYDLNASN